MKPFLVNGIIDI